MATHDVDEKHETSPIRDALAVSLAALSFTGACASPRALVWCGPDGVPTEFTRSIGDDQTAVFFGCVVPNDGQELREEKNEDQAPGDRLLDGSESIEI